MAPTGISSGKAGEVLRRETLRFAELRPRGTKVVEDAHASMPRGVPMNWMASAYLHPPIVVDGGSGAWFTDVDGNAYLDFNLADTSMFTGYGVEALARVAGERVAAGSQFLLPTEDAERSPRRSPRGSASLAGSTRSPRPRRTPRRSGWRGP